MPLAAHPRTYWRGVLTCVRAAAMLDGMCALLTSQGHGELANHIGLSQGSYTNAVAASKGEHSGCGVVDISRWYGIRLMTPAEWALIVRAGRTVGFAIWHRLAIPKVWVEHAHAAAVGCQDLAQSAKDQITWYIAGHNGLAGEGPDDGPRDFPGGPGVTWEQYLAAKDAAATAPTPTTEEEDEMNRDVIAALFLANLGRAGSDGEIAGRIDDAVRNAKTPLQVRGDLIASDEAKRHAVAVAFPQYLGRQATPAEVTAWLTAATSDAIVDGVRNSNEAKNRKA